MRLRLNTNEKLTLINNLGTLIGAGVPILEAVSVSQNYTKGNTKIVLKEMEKDLNQGKSISDTFSKFPKAFSPIIINLIKAAEESGNLDGALKNIEVNLKKEMEFNGKIKAALTYPALVMAVFAFIMLVILLYVIPKVAQVFSKLKIDIPKATELIIMFSNFLVGNLLLIGILTPIVLILFFLLIKFRKEFVISLVTKLPGISQLMQILDLAQFTHNMSVLLKSGVPITHGLELAEHVVFKKVIKEAVVAGRKAVSDGNSLSYGFRQSKAIPQLMILIIEAGERSGTLEKAMEELASRYEMDAESKLRAITTLMEPLMLVLIGGMVGGIMLSIIAPIYSLIGNITGASGL